MSIRGFNLLRPQLAPPTSWDKIYSWMVGTARIIVIFVEIIVIGAFAVRVVVDTIGKNLDKEVSRIEAELNAYVSLEGEYRDIQNRTDTYHQLWTTSSNSSNHFKYIQSVIDQYQGVISIQINQKDMSITGELPLANIRDIEENFKSKAIGSIQDDQAIFKTVVLVDVDSEGKDENEIATFTIIADFVPKTENRTLISSNSQ